MEFEDFSRLCEPCEHKLRSFDETQELFGKPNTERLSLLVDRKTGQVKTVHATASVYIKNAMNQSESTIVSLIWL